MHHLGAVDQGALLWTRLAQRTIGLFEFPATEQAHGVDQGPGGVAQLFVKVFVRIQVVVTVRVGLIVTDVTVNKGGASGWDQSHVRQPIREAAPERFHAGSIAVNDD
jgi:hypothetical protein